MKQHWSYDSFFYQIYPLGFCGALYKNDFQTKPLPRLDIINGWIDHLKRLNINAVYLGPVFESTYHGYDTVDYYKVDRRLGNNDTLKNLIVNLHNNDIRVVLDGVFNHTGRDFWAFKDVLKNKKSSRFCSWFKSLDFTKNNSYNDGFCYEGWNGNYDLVKLDLSNPEVKDHLLYAVKMWIEEFNIDGIRLDAADCLDFEFMKELKSFTKNLKNDFWLMGEVIHGDYNNWANPLMLDSVTNYEMYKGIYSSLNDNNYFEIAYSLNRQFGEAGLYKNLLLYNFADNHDVNRVASILKDKRHLYPLYLLLFTIPGIPSLYYGSEWAAQGIKLNNSDYNLRPSLHFLNDIDKCYDLEKAIIELSKLRISSEVLKYGNYKQLLVKHNQLSFLREYKGKSIIVIINSSDKDCNVEINLPDKANTCYKDLLNSNMEYYSNSGKLIIKNLWNNWGMILEKI